MNQSTLYLGLMILSYAGFVHTSLSDTEETDDGNYDRVRRGWSMLRLGRGLQMLRLGKRSLFPQALNRQSSLEQVRTLLANLLKEEEHSPERRQPPLPRYGRDLDIALDSLDNEYPYFHENYNTPKSGALSTGGRFRRSADMAGKPGSSNDWNEAEMVARTKRAVALPRIGRFLSGQLYKWRPVKAVPIPRIGRDYDEGLYDGDLLDYERLESTQNKALDKINDNANDKTKSQ